MDTPPTSTSLRSPVADPLWARGEHRGFHWYQAVRACLDICAILAAFYISLRILPFYRPFLVRRPLDRAAFSHQGLLLLPILAVELLLLALAQLYRSRHLPPRALLTRLIRAQFWCLAGLSVFLFSTKSDFASRLLVYSYIVLFLPIAFIFRLLLSKYYEKRRAHAYNIERVCIIGTRVRAQMFIRSLSRTQDRIFHIVGCFDPEPASAPQQIGGVPFLGSTSHVRDFIFHQSVDWIAIAMRPDRVPEFQEILEAAQAIGLHVMIVPNFYLQNVDPETPCQMTEVNGMPLTTIFGVQQSQYYRAAKRVLDLVLSAAALLLLSPLMVVIALLIKISSPDGPVLYDWKVMGINKKPIHSYKFRTMVPFAEQMKASLLDKNEMKGPVFKLKNDPRVTPIGRLLRRFSLDELPQLYSVLKGDLSLVGPRPPSQSESDRFAYWHRRKLSVKPGLTCLWQIRGRNEINDFDDWVRLDLEYIAHASLWMDLQILARTVPAVMRGRGAY